MVDQVTGKGEEDSTARRVGERFRLACFGLRNYPWDRMHDVRLFFAIWQGPEVEIMVL